MGWFGFLIAVRVRYKCQTYRFVFSFFASLLDIHEADHIIDSLIVSMSNVDNSEIAVRPRPSIRQHLGFLCILHVLIYSLSHGAG